MSTNYIDFFKTKVNGKENPRIVKDDENKKKLEL